MKSIFNSCKSKNKLPIRLVSFGKPNVNDISIGSQCSMPFDALDKNHLNKPKIACEIMDMLPEGYPSKLTNSSFSALEDLINLPDTVSSIGVDVLAVRLNSIKNNPKNLNNSVSQLKDLIERFKLPLIVLGINNRELDKKYLPIICEEMAGWNLLIGYVEEETYKDIIPACRDNGHCVIARSPIDINLAKQLNILITEMNFDPSKIVIDPNMGGLGYGLDYAYSVIERIRIAALEGDDMLNMPIVVFSGEETWRTKEAKSDITDSMWGNSLTRSITWEVITTSSMIMAGADLAIMRHSSAIKHISEYIKGMNQ